MMTQEQKAARKAQRQLETMSRKMALAANLRVGAFVKNTWGATMCSVDYFEVVAITKNKVSLRRARTDGDARPNCTTSIVTLLGASQGEPTHVATVRSGRIYKEGQGARDYWSSYEFCQVGDQTTCYSD